MRYSFLYIKISISLMFGGKLSSFISLFPLFIFLIIYFVFFPASFLPILVLFILHITSNDQSDKKKKKKLVRECVVGLQLFPTLLIRFDSLLYQIKNESKGGKLFKVGQFLSRRMREHMIRNRPFRLFT